MNDYELRVVTVIDRDGATREEWHDIPKGEDGQHVLEEGACHCSPAFYGSRGTLPELYVHHRVAVPA